ncbi:MULTISPECIES: RNA-binding cell elongation regulator Jag/EloR [unclassified Gemella]|uniref:RNA-binding cell elongation regulator Jag/EloR n=1 Tax=unclassified Gemella TaxID=2624949 RepID=UPI00207B647A|nr:MULTISPECIES: RNA-binding cell elongation regulator Jag/EloR [unclassified Gemella]
MNEYVYVASSVDEAIKKGLKDLFLTEENVKIEVEEAGNNGILGLFKKEARVKLIPLEPEYDKEKIKNSLLKTQPKVSAVPKKEVIEEPVEEIKEEVVVKEENKKREDLIVLNKDKIVDYMTKIVHSMGFDTAKLVFIEEGNKNYTLRITEVESTSLLIGKRGNTLNSLQFLANNYAKKFTKSYFRINIDCDEYRENRKETLEELAINMAKKSKKLGKPVQLEPMTSFERKIIHNALSEIKNVETESHGKEPHRYLVITAK